MSDEYFLRLSELTGLKIFKTRQYTVGGIDRGVAGVKNAYIVAVGVSDDPERGGPEVRLFMRFKPSLDEERLRSSLETRVVKPPTAELELEVGNDNPDSEDPFPDYVCWIWRYSARRPGLEHIVAILDSTLDVIKNLVPPLPNTCEGCGGGPVVEISVRKGTPGYYCRTCKKNLATTKVLQHLQQFQFDEGRAFFIGAASPILVGIGVGYLVSYFPPVVLLLFILWPFVWICALKAAGFSSDHWEALRLARGLVAQAEEKGDPEVAAIFERIGFKSWDRWDRLEDLLLFWPLLATLIAYVTYFPFVAWHLGESAFAVFMRAPFWHLVVLPLSLLIMVMTMGLAYGAGERQFESRNTVAFEDLKP